MSEALTLKGKLYWKAFWALRAARFAWLDLTTPKPTEGEFCGTYLKRVGQEAGPHGTVVGIDVVGKNAVWRGGRWTRREGNEDAYFAANPNAQRWFPVAIPSIPSGSKS